MLFKNIDISAQNQIPEMLILLLSCFNCIRYFPANCSSTTCHVQTRNLAAVPLDAQKRSTCDCLPWCTRLAMEMVNKMGYTCLGNCKAAAFVVLWNRCVKRVLFSRVKATHKLTVKKQDTHTYDTHTKPFLLILPVTLSNTSKLHLRAGDKACLHGRQHFSEAPRTHVYMYETAFQWSCKDMFTCVKPHFSEAARTYPWSFLVVIPGAGETKVGNLQNMVVRHKHIAGCQVTMNALRTKMIHTQVSTKIMHTDMLLHRWRQ